MAKYHDIDSDIWEELLEFEPGPKLLYIYLFSNPLCRPSGIYKIKLQTIQHHTKTKVEDLMSLCGKFIEYDFETSEVFVRGKMKRILGGFKNNDKMRKAIVADYKGLVSPFISCSFYLKYKGALEGLVDPPLTLPLALPLPKEEELEKEKEVAKSITPEEILESDPAFDRVQAYRVFFENFPHETGEKASSPLADFGAANLFLSVIVNPELETRIHNALKNYKKARDEGGAEPLRICPWLQDWPRWEKKDKISFLKPEESTP